MKKKILTNGIVFIRNSDFTFDVRMNKEADVALDLGMTVQALGWVRDGSKNFTREIQKKSGKVELSIYTRESVYGKGIKNILNIFFYNFWIFKTLIKKRNSYSLIHACDLDVVLPALFLARVFRKKIIYDIFDFYAETHIMPMILKNFLSAIEKFVINQVDAIIICNDARYRQIEGTHPKFSLVIHNTPDLEFEQTEERICVSTSGVPKIVYTGILCPEGRLLAEVLESKEALTHYELHIAGTGPLQPRVEQVVNDNNNVFFYGQLTNRDAIKLEKECDILFATYNPKITNNRYSAPNKIYEAMALGKPVIVCKGTCADDLVIDEGFGLVIDYDVNQFWEAVDHINSSVELRNKIAINGNRAYSEKYSWIIMKNRLKRLYKYMIYNQQKLYNKNVKNL